MIKRILTLLLAISMSLFCFVPAFAAEEYDFEYHSINAAGMMDHYGFFKGVGYNEDGTPDYNVHGALTREQAITLIVRMMEREENLKSFNCPFNDVADWAKSYVGYAYEKGITGGTSATTFGGQNKVTAAQFITFILRLLEYKDGVDFDWDKAYLLSDELNITNNIRNNPGLYSTVDYSNGGNGKNGEFTRGDAALIMNAMFDKKVKLNGKEMTINRKVKDSLTKGLGYTFDRNESGDIEIYLKDTSDENFFHAVDKAVQSGANKFYIGIEDYYYGQYVDKEYYNKFVEYANNYVATYPDTTRRFEMYGMSGGLISALDADATIWGQLTNREVVNYNENIEEDEETYPEHPEWKEGYVCWDGNPKPPHYRDTEEFEIWNEWCQRRLK